MPDNVNTVCETKGYVLKVRSTKKEKSVGTIGPKISDFSPSGIAFDTWNQIFIGGSKTNGQLPIRKLSNNADTWDSLTTYKLTNGTPIGASRNLISDSKGNLYVINDKDKLILLARNELNIQDDNGFTKGLISQSLLTARPPILAGTGYCWKGNSRKVLRLTFCIMFQMKSDDEPKNPESEKWHNCVSKASAIQGNKKRDALFIDDIQGRYLWFKLILSGNEILSPVIKSVTIFFPRISYLIIFLLSIRRIL